MKKQPPNIIEGDKEFQEFLDRPFAIDMLAPVFGERSVDTLFKGWQGEELTGWYRFRNCKGNILEFFPEGTYSIKKNERYGINLLLKIPQTVGEFVQDMNRVGIQLFIRKKYQLLNSQK